MHDESEIHKNKLTGKTYISPQVATRDGALRIASKVIDSEGLHFVKVKDEVVLRRTETGRIEIVAKFLEDSRDLTVLTIQSFNGNTGNPHHTSFSFIGSDTSNPGPTPFDQQSHQGHPGYTINEDSANFDANVPPWPTVARRRAAPTPRRSLPVRRWSGSPAPCRRPPRA